MIREYVIRFSRWYNGLHGYKPVFYFLVFCLAFLILLWVSIRFIGFDTKVYTTNVPRHIGQPSGTQFKDSLTLKKN